MANYPVVKETSKDYRDYSVSPPLPNPYLPGCLLRVSLHDHLGAHEIEVEIMKAFMPFTVAVVLLVRPISGPISSLPNLLILKFLDIRFTPRTDVRTDNEPPQNVWTVHTRAAFLEGARRARSGEWHNEWEEYIAGGRPHREGEPRPGDDPLSELTSFDNDMNHYYHAQASYEREVQAYRALRPLQSTGIPRFYGCVSLVTGDQEPLLASIPGIALEYIDGVTLDHFTLDTNITAEQAERVVQGTLQVMRSMRDAFLLHNDLAFRNIMLRRILGFGNDEYDFDRPVIIDFGEAYLYKPDEEDDTRFIHDLRFALIRMRYTFKGESWHIPSPYLALYKPMPTCGYKIANARIEEMSHKWRERFFEEIPERDREAFREFVDGDDGETYVYEPARWRLRAGVRSSDADRHWQPDDLPPPPGGNGVFA